MNAESLYPIMLPQEPDVLNVEDVERIIGVGRATVYKMIQDGQLRGVLAGKKYVVPKISVICYLVGENAV
ncbi:MAG: helix-turn-helix domain-containing protein [Faecalibacterium sp.]|jgi:excisionase family DNA binding protein|nr:helix-turn-helix domain-containing protein [Faecalibacterium sp.]